MQYSLNEISIVFKKEVKDLFRDKRIYVALLMPVIILIVGAILGVFISLLAMNDSGKVYVNDIDNTLILKLDKQLSNNYDIVESNDVLSEFNNSDFYAGIVIDGNNITYYSNDNVSASTLIYSTFKSIVTDANDQYLQSVLTENGIDPNVISKNDLAFKSTTSGIGNEKTVGSTLIVSFIIPYLLIISIIGITSSFSADLIAGEKERSTFELILSTKSNRNNIILGKLVALVTITIIPLLIFLIGLAIITSFVDNVFNLPNNILLLTFIGGIFLSMGLSAIGLLISIIAKNVKEATSYLSFPVFVIMFSSYLSFLGNPKDLYWFQKFVPVINIYSLFKVGFASALTVPFILIVVITNIVFILLLTILIVRMANNEKYIFRN